MLRTSIGRKQFRQSPQKTVSKRKLRFSPTAWGKLVYLRDLGPTEIGGFGISHPSDPLLVTEFVLIRQVSSMVTVAFDDGAVADFFDEQVSLGRQPHEFARIWIHTHPSDSPLPSGTDEETFKRCFGNTDWAVMFILAKEGATYGRLRCGTGPGLSQRIGCEVDYTEAFAGSDHECWRAEYAQSVTVLDPFGDQDWSIALPGGHRAARPRTDAMFSEDAVREWQERLHRRDGQYFAAFEDSELRDRWAGE